MCGDIRKAIFNIVVILLFAFTGLMIGMHYAMVAQSNNWYFGNANIVFLFKLAAFFVISLYSGLAIMALLKYSVKRRLCSVTNIKIIVISVLLFYPLSWQVNKIRKHKETMEDLLAETP